MRRHNGVETPLARPFATFVLMLPMLAVVLQGVSVAELTAMCTVVSPRTGRNMLAFGYDDGMLEFRDWQGNLLQVRYGFGEVTVLCGHRYGSSPLPRLFVASTDSGGALRVIDPADINNDIDGRVGFGRITAMDYQGTDRLYVASSDAGGALRRLRTSDLSDQAARYGLSEVTAAWDGWDTINGEYLLVASTDSGGALRCLQKDTLADTSPEPRYGWGRICALSSGDVDEDGNAEIVVGSSDSGGAIRFIELPNLGTDLADRYGFGTIYGVGYGLVGVAQELGNDKASIVVASSDGGGAFRVMEVTRSTLATTMTDAAVRWGFGTCAGMGLDEMLYQTGVNVISAATTDSGARAAHIMDENLTDLTRFANGAQPSYAVTFSTFIGGSREGQVRDVAVDGDGNVYIAGGTESADFPRTIGPAHRGWCDVFVVKYDSGGHLLWSRLIGGPEYDRAYAIEVDSQGCVYLGGRAGPGYPVTTGVVQPRFGGDSNPNTEYGLQDGFITKLSPDGATILWSTYFGGNDRGFFRDIAIDGAGNVYGALTAGSVDQPHITQGAFCTIRPASSFGVVTKISADGTDILWATYFGGTDGKYAFGTPSIRVDSQGFVVVASHAASTNMPTTPGAYSRTNSGKSDMHIAKFTPDGSQLAFGTYLGGSGSEYGDTHNLALASDGSIVAAATTMSPDFPIVPGAFQTAYGGSGGGYNQQGDGFIAHLSSDGKGLLASTFYGGSSGEGIEGVGVDAQGHVYITGGTYSTDLPSVGAVAGPNGIMSQRPDACAAKFSPDLTKLLFSTYFGGSDWDLGLAAAVHTDGAFYLAGETKSGDFPLHQPSQSRLSGAKNGILVRFSPLGAQ